jgi:hypothetical protein
MGRIQFWEPECSARITLSLVVDISRLGSERRDKVASQNDASVGRNVVEQYNLLV